MELDKRFRTDLYVCLDCGHKFAQPVYKFFRKGSHILVKPACPKCGSIRLVMLRRITQGVRKGPKPPIKISDERVFIMRILAILVFALLLPAPPIHAEPIHATAFVSPDCSYAIVSSLIGNASNAIYLAVYSFSNPRLLAELNSAIHRGVSVYVILEDRHVSNFEDSYTLYAAYNLTQAGAHVRRAPEDYRYMHAKYMVVDNSSVLVFTGNFAKTGVPKDPSYGNRERGLVIYDKRVAEFFASEFLEDFSRGKPYEESQGTGTPVGTYAEHGEYPHPFAPQSVAIEALEAFVLPNSTALNEYLRLIRSANESVLVEIAYADFRRDSVDDVNPLLKALTDAAAKGVNVRVIIGFYNDEQASVALYLRDHGVRVARGPTEDNAQELPVEPIFAAIHTKTVIIDGRIAIVSSANRSENAFLNNREAGLIVRSSDAAEYFSRVFERDREHSLVKPPLGGEEFLSIDVISPSNGSVVESPVRFSVAVNSSLDGTLRVYVDGEERLEENFSAGYSEITVELRLDPGEHEVKFVAIAGNLVERSSLYIRVVEGPSGPAESVEKPDRTTIALLVAVAILALIVGRLKKRRFFRFGRYTIRGPSILVEPQ